MALRRMVARGEPIRAANQDSPAARRARIGEADSQSIERGSLPLLTNAKGPFNPAVYIPMQGPSELGAGGKLVDWDRTAALSEIQVRTLVIGAEHDTMDPKHMKWMASAFPNGRYLYCPDGSHFALYDDQVTYFEGLIRFIQDVDVGRQ